MTEFVKAKLAYKTELGKMYIGDSEKVLNNLPLSRLRGKVQLILTSPPFPLNRKKRYGNLNGDEYIDWLKRIAILCKDYLTPNGSVALELGNAWEPGKPTMSTLPLKALLGFLETSKMNLCQEFICYNPARLPTPAQWVTVERIRVKDAFTRVWWMSPSERPKGDNRKVLTQYSKSMQELFRRGTYNPGRRPSEHLIGKKSFLKDNQGAIPPNVIIPPLTEMIPFDLLAIANTSARDPYQTYCKIHNIIPHPARMQAKLAEFFIRLATDEEDLVMDPFAGSNTTGSMCETLRRKWIGIELDAGYASASQARFRIVGGIPKPHVVNTKILHSI
jgi:site-specific DNA-methyltransferase (cytosine-N4-specific)